MEAKHHRTEGRGISLTRREVIGHEREDLSLNHRVKPVLEWNTGLLFERKYSILVYMSRDQEMGYRLRVYNRFYDDIC